MSSTLTAPDAERLSPETTRKLVHMAIGFAALSLRWLSWQQAAAIAATAVIFNAFVLPRIGGRSIARHDRGTDAGIILYPIAVLGLILAFRSRLDLAGAVWAMLAFGDAAAGIVGRIVRGRTLPWNPKKTWAGTVAFIEVALPAAYLVSAFIAPWHTIILNRFLAIAIAVVVAAIVESTDSGIDDNVTIPLAGALALFAGASLTEVPKIALGENFVPWLVAHTGLALAGYLLGSVDLSGLTGGWLLGAVILLFGGWPLYCALLVFFVLGTGATKLGWRSKRVRGLAQEKGGRRGFSHAFANTGIAALCAIGIWLWPSQLRLLWIAAIAALATAAADTVGSEIGQWLGRNAFLPHSFRRVPPGTEGAISLEGTLCGIAAGLAVAVAGVRGLELRMAEIHSAEAVILPLYLIWAVAIAAALGSYAESLAGAWNRERARPVPNGTLNFLNTAMGAGFAVGLVILWSGGWR